MSDCLNSINQDTAKVVAMAKAHKRMEVQYIHNECFRFKYVISESFNSKGLWQ